MTIKALTIAHMHILDAHIHVNAMRVIAIQ